MKRLADQTFYELLEVPEGAAAGEIEAACDRARELYGPGSLAIYTLMTPDEADLLARRLEEARATLLDPAARARYDEALRRPGKAVAAAGVARRGGAPSLPPVIPALQLPLMPPLVAQPPRLPPIPRVSEELEELEERDDLDELDERDALDARDEREDAEEPGGRDELQQTAPGEAQAREEMEEPAPVDEPSSARSVIPLTTPVVEPPPLEQHPAAELEASQAPPSEAPPEAPEPDVAASAIAASDVATPPAPPSVSPAFESRASEIVAPAARPPGPILLDREVREPLVPAEAPAPSPPVLPAATPPPLPAAAAAPPPPPPVPIPVVVDGAWTGGALRQMREARGLTVQQIAERTKVTRHHIDNIEAERFGALPAPVYLRGILLSIARELRLDGQKVARAFLERSAAALGTKQK